MVGVVLFVAVFFVVVVTAAAAAAAAVVGVGAAASASALIRMSANDASDIDPHLQIKRTPHPSDR